MQLFGFDIKLTRGNDVAPPRSPLDDRWYQPMWYQAQSGIEVDPDTAMMYSAVYGSVKIICETIASIPLITYKRQGEAGKKRADNHPVYSLLKSRPNNRSTSMSFRETLTAHYLLRGNGYAEISRGYGGEPVAMNILHPTRVEPKIDDETGLPVYLVDIGGGRRRAIPFWDMFHLQGYTESGLEGMSVIAYMKEAIGLGLAAESFGAAFFANNATPAGVLQMAAGQELSEPAKERLKTDWQRKYGGVQKAGTVAVLEEGLEWKPIAVPAQDAQWLENRKFQITDIARFFRIPPHMLAELDRSTNNNIEHQSIEFLTFTMLAHFVRWEQTIARDLFNGSRDPESKFSDKYFAEFLINGLTRGDIKTRYAAYAVGRQWGWLSVNDIREMENMNPIGDEGDVYLSPLNMVDAKNFGDLPDNTGEGGGEDGSSPGSTDTNNPKPSQTLLNSFQRNALSAPQLQIDFSPSVEAFRSLFEETVGRLLRKEEKFLFKKRTDDEIREFYKEHEQSIKDLLRPITRGFFEQARVAVIVRGATPVPPNAVADANEVLLRDFATNHFQHKPEDWKANIEECAKTFARSLVEEIEKRVS